MMLAPLSRLRRVAALLLAGFAALVPSSLPTQARVSSVPRIDVSGIVWLCRPGLAADPCTADLDTTVMYADGSRAIKRVAPAANPAFDCFYVYPTVSRQQTINATLRVDPAETAVAVAQASRFSQVCRVWSPMYRQVTLLALALGQATDPEAIDAAYQSLLAGWKDYLAHDNGGRPIVFIGHSQGAAMLIRLLQSQVDPNPALRRRLVSAIILGGNVAVPATAGAQGSFSHLPACRSAAQFGCVLAYSSFPAQPPADSLFGRPGQGVSLQAGQIAAAGLRVLCVNPAAVAGGTGRLDPYFPTSTAPPPGPPVSTPWVEYPALYTATCMQAGGANWLNVTTHTAASDHRPRLQQIGGARWGFHVGDVNLALGDLVGDVRRQEASYQAAHAG